MYRAVSYYFMKNDLIKNGLLKIDKVATHLDKINIQFKKQSDQSLHTFLNHQDIEKEIRSMEISNLVSEVSKHAIVRHRMVALQQKMGGQKCRQNLLTNHRPKRDDYAVCPLHQNTRLVHKTSFRLNLA